MKVEIGEYPAGNEERHVEIRIDEFDSWNADYTLALIALPLLKQLKEQKSGAPDVDDEDVPDKLKSTNALPKENKWDIDSNHFLRWEYVLDCIIWSIDKHVNGGTVEDKFFEQGVDSSDLNAYYEKKQKGFVLLGKYFCTLWS